jgi:hypothetical protein
MSEVVFGANQQPVAAEAAPATPATPESQVPAVAQTYAPPAQNRLVGDYLPSFGDIILPRLNIVQNIGDLKDSYEPGSLVYAQSVELFVPQSLNAKTGIVERPATPPVIVTILGFKENRYVEKVAGGARGLICKTEQEVRAAGGTLEWAEWNLKKASGMKRFEVLADALVLIQRPESCKPADGGEDPTFVYEVEGNCYTLAFWALRGVTYTAAGKRVLFPARKTGCLKKDWFHWSWAMSTREETYPNGNKAWIPILLPAKANTPAMDAFCLDVLTAKTQPESEA